MKITKETRLESLEQITPEIHTRQMQCLKALEEIGQGTANEIAMTLFHNGVTPYFNRNYAHPRLNEMVEDEVIEIIGKKVDPISKRKCAIYSIRQ